MTTAYLMNTYPLTSTTFIRRELEAVEELGLQLPRLAVRRWDGHLVDPRDIAEQARTQYILTDNTSGLLRAFFADMVMNPLGLTRSLPTWLKLWFRSDRGMIRNTAYLLEAIYLRRQAATMGLRHIHVHFGTNAASVAMLSHLMGGPTYSFTSHGPDEFNRPEEHSFDLKIHHAAFVIAISRYCRDRLAALALPKDAAKIQIARCGIALEEFQPDDQPFPENRTLVCIGRLCPQKGQVHIPAAVGKLRDEFPDLRVILVGDGESRAEIEAEIAKHQVADFIELRGWVANLEVRDLLRASRGMLLPSYAEGLPIVIMEAFALGRPVISTTVAGIPELVDETCGWIIPPGSHDQLVAAMRAMLRATPAELAEMGRVGRKRVEHLHDRRIPARLLEAKFREVTSTAAQANR